MSKNLRVPPGGSRGHYQQPRLSPNPQSSPSFLPASSSSSSSSASSSCSIPNPQFSPFVPSSLHKPRGDLAPSAFQGLTPLVPFKRLLTHRSTPGLFRQITNQQWPKFQRWHFTFCTWHIKAFDEEDFEQKHWRKVSGISIMTFYVWCIEAWIYGWG